MLSFIDVIFDSKAFAESENNVVENPIKTLNIEKIPIKKQSKTEINSFVDTTLVLKYIDAIFDNTVFENWENNDCNVVSKLTFRIIIPINSNLAHLKIFKKTFNLESENAGYFYLPMIIKNYALAKQIVDDLSELGIDDAEILQINFQDIEQIQDLESYIDIEKSQTY